MNPVAMSVTASLITFFLTGLLGLGGRLMLKSLKRWMDEEIKSRLVPNGGSSIDDKLRRIEKSVTALMELHEEDPTHAHNTRP
ncbi:hypothetical protein [Nonomuraea cypriaca]|uniref:hypothetical protein n=1 Tax=Nonomuraea cypriaca TaxID=1187855 RepID=UPI0018A82327|nr:hypothetical protein [Nonomuraea cypriaca]